VSAAVSGGSLRRLWLNLGGALLLALGGAGARAEEALEPGQSFTGFIALDGQQVP